MLGEKLRMPSSLVSPLESRYILLMSRDMPSVPRKLIAPNESALPVEDNRSSDGSELEVERTTNGAEAASQYITEEKQISLSPTK